MRRLFRGVYAPADLTLTLGVRADAALRALPACAAISGELGVALWGLPRPLRRMGQVTPDPLLADPVTCSLPAAEARRDNRDALDIAEVQLPPQHVKVHDGRRLVTPARLFLDLAEVWCLEDLVALGDAALRRGVATSDELAEMVRWGSGRPGVVLARRALPMLDAGAESAMESRLRLIIVQAGFPRPEANAAVYDEHGGFLARPDLRLLRYKIAIEYDGAEHAGPRRRSADESRRYLLRQHGWVVLAFTSEEVLHQPWLVACRVREELLRRGWTLANSNDG
ncbi:MAG: hypothetical protein QOJ92_1071 [Frankiales bacterium]|nr:hypothetical protein [Frankiales bacterium]